MSAPAIVVIGGSAGGVEAVIRLISQLPEDLPAAIGIVLHFPPVGASALPRILARRGRMPAYHPEDRTPVRPGEICIAPPDRHLWLEDGLWRVTAGPRENGHRPAVDPLFRSAARAYGPRAIGVILSGLFDDGADGARAIKARRGTVVVQDPADAAFPDMPRNAIEAVSVDDVRPAPDLAAAVAERSREIARVPHAEVAAKPGGGGETPPEEQKAMEEPNHLLGRRSMYTCPECGGVLAESEEGPALWFKCHVGHSYSPDSLVAEQTRSLESALWAAYRALEERSSLSRRMAERSKRLGHETMRARHLAEAERARRHADTIRRLLDSPPGVASGTDEATGEQGPEIGNA